MKTSAKSLVTSRDPSTPLHSAQDDMRGGRGLSGHLRLVCAADEAGRTFIREQSFRAPVHLSKPHHEEGVLVVNVVNPTAGLLAGDRVRYDVSVESGARVAAHGAEREPGASDQRGRCARGAGVSSGERRMAGELAGDVHSPRRRALPAADNRARRGRWRSVAH